MGCVILYVVAYNIFVYTIDGVVSFTIYKNRYTLFTAYPRAMDGGAPWVITRAVRRTTAKILYAYVGDITVVDTNPATRTVEIL